MRYFLDSGFLLTLLFETSGSPIAWQTIKALEGPLLLGSLQIFNAENRLQRQIEADESTNSERAMAAGALQRLRWYLDQQVFQSVPIDYDIAIHLASQWQRRGGKILTSLLLLWPALAVTSGATHFLSFDPRTRTLARTANLQLLPDKL